MAPSGLLRRRSLVEARAHSLLCPARPKDGPRARPQRPHDLRRHALVVDGPDLPAEQCGRAARPDGMANVPSKRTEDRAHVRSGARAPGMAPGPHAVAAACRGPREKGKGSRGAGLCASARKEAKGEAGVQASVPAGGPPVRRLLENIFPRALVDKGCTRRGSSRFTSSSRTPAMKGRPRD